MEKTTYSYELMFVVDLTDGEDAVKATVEKFTNLIAANGEISDVAEWGKRRLAYPINDKNEGYYVVVNFKSVSDFPAEIERLMNIDEAIMRSMIIRPEFVAPAKEEAVEAVAQEAAAEEAPAADAE